VHSNDDGELAVVGVMIEPGEANDDYAPVWDHLPATSGPEMVLPNVVVDPQALLPRSRHAYRYTGSLTTPPCSEDVAWAVFAEPVTLSPEQIAGFEAIYMGNYRPVQPLNGRALHIDTD